jgi:hypothetical protein
MMRGVLTASLALAAILAASAPAFADAIDGEWCSKEGKNLEIEGPKIRTPAGIDTTGQYTRHSFAYEPPAGDPEKGLVIVMRIFSDEDMELARIKNGEMGPKEMWHRCNVTS